MVPSRKSQVTWGPSMQFWSLRAWKLGVKLWVFESFRVGKKNLTKNKRGANPTTKLLEVMHMSRSKFIYLGLPIFGFKTDAFKHVWPPLRSWDFASMLRVANTSGTWNSMWTCPEIGADIPPRARPLAWSDNPMSVLSGTVGDAWATNLWGRCTKYGI